MTIPNKEELVREINNLIKWDTSKRIENRLNELISLYGINEVNNLFKNNSILIFDTIFNDLEKNSYSKTYTLSKLNIGFDVAINSTKLAYNTPYPTKLSIENKEISPIVYLIDIITSTHLRNYINYIGENTLKLIPIILKNRRIDENGLDSNLEDGLLGRVISWKIGSSSIKDKYLNYTYRIASLLIKKGCTFNNSSDYYDNAFFIYLNNYSDVNILLCDVVENRNLLNLLVNHIQKPDLTNSNMINMITHSSFYIKTISTYIKDSSAILNFINTMNKLYKDNSFTKELVNSVVLKKNFTIPIKKEIINYYSEIKTNRKNLSAILSSIEE